MQKYSYIFLFIIGHVFYIAQASAEVYRWSDSDGKLHYGDKKPKVKADDITETVNKQNIDTSTAEHQKLEALFRKENASDRAYRAQQNQPSQAQEQACANARERLFKLEGRVEFIDKDGKVVKVTEQERIQRANEMRKMLAERCPPQ